MARVTRPETHTLTLANGETLIVKKRLNAGERREMLRAMRGPDGLYDGALSGLCTILAYLLDWTVKDDLSGEPLVIRGKTREEITAVLDSLDSEDFGEIKNLVDAWDDKMIAERKEEKKILFGKPESVPVSSSPQSSESHTPTQTS